MLCEDQIAKIQFAQRKKTNIWSQKLKEHKVYRIKSHMRTIKIQIERKRNATTILIEDQSGRLTEKEEKKVRRALNAKIHIMRKEVEDVLPWITDASAPSQQQFKRLILETTDSKKAKRKNSSQKVRQSC